MKAFNGAPVQFHTNEGIGLSLANATARKRLDRLRDQKAREADFPPACRPPAHAPTGKVLDDLITLGTTALVTHVEALLAGKPLEVMAESPNITRIRVCGAVDYVIDRNKCSVLTQPAPPSRREKASKQQAPWHHPFEFLLDAVDVLNPLGRPGWLVHVAARPGWFGYAFARHDDGQDQLFLTTDHTVYALSKVTRLAFERLRHHPAVIALQHALSTALTLHTGPSLVTLAMRARVHTGKGSLLARHLNLVWRHRSAYETMARENPRLLPLLTAWLNWKKPTVQPGMQDAIPAMRADLLAEGLTPAAWRCVAQHGLKRLLPTHTHWTPWDALVGTLQALSAARWPEVPPRGFLRLLHDTAGLPEDYDTGAREGVPGWFWQLACTKAAAHQNDVHAYLGFFGEIPLMAWLVRQYGLLRDQDSHKTFAFLRQTAARHADIAPKDTGPEWALWLAGANWPMVAGLAIVPLQSSAALLEESIGLHNCADSYSAICRAETQVLLSLRDRRSGKRVALASVERNGSAWSLGQVAGPCNRPVAPWVKKIANQAAGVVRYQYGRRLLLNSATPVGGSATATTA